MKLSQKDAELFMNLWAPLMNYVSEKYGIRWKTKKKTWEAYSNIAKKSADKLWGDVSIIDRYIEEIGDKLFENGEADILRSWKRCVRGKFVLERYLQKGVILISPEDQQVYQVQGVMSTWKELLSSRPAPLLLETCIIPFKNVIISDGLVMLHDVPLEREIEWELQKIYIKAKKDGTVHKSL